MSKENTKQFLQVRPFIGFGLKKGDVLVVRGKFYGSYGRGQWFYFDDYKLRCEIGGVSALFAREEENAIEWYLHIMADNRTISLPRYRGHKLFWEEEKNS